MDPIEYILNVSGPGLDTTITGIDENSYLFNGNNILQYSSSYTWYIRATDGIDTTESRTDRTFRTALSSGIDLTDCNVAQFTLSQNYPNPFNSSTEIIFEIKDNTEIDLSIFNILGEKVQTLKKGYYKAGYYQALFDASELPAGIYIYKLQAPNYSLKRKCLYIK